MEPGEKKVPTPVALQMIAAAFVFDLIGMAAELWTLGVGGLVMDIFSAFTFTLWLARYDVRLWSGKNHSLSMLAVFMDMIPLADWTFPWTWRVALLIFRERKEAPKESKVALNRWGH